MATHLLLMQRKGKGMGLLCMLFRLLRLFAAAASKAGRALAPGTPANGGSLFA